MRRILLVVAVSMLIAGVAFAQARFFTQGSITVNPYTPVTVTVKGTIKGFFIYSDAVNYKMAVNQYTNYTPMEKGGAFNFPGLNMTSLILYLQGNGETETGLVHYMIQK